MKNFFVKKKKDEGQIGEMKMRERRGGSGNVRGDFVDRSRNYFNAS